VTAAKKGDNRKESAVEIKKGKGYEMAFLWTTLKVKDMEESLKFYQGIVGLPLNRRFAAGPGVEIAFLGDDGTKVELICNEKIKEVNIGSDISLGFAVKSLDEKIVFLEGKGIKLHSGPFAPNPHTKFAYILDPNGLRIQFVEEA
jgi:lactoylglutathione lyase